MITARKYTLEELKTILVEGSYLDQEVFNLAVSESEDPEVVVSSLIGDAELTEGLWGQALAEYYDLPFADLNLKPPHPEQVKKLPETLAKKYRLVIFDENENHVVLATDNPSNQPEVLRTLTDFFNNSQISLAFALTEYIDLSLTYYDKPLQDRLSDIISNSEQVVPKLLGEILNESKKRRASDIHFEPNDKSDQVRVRLRIDGVLLPVAVLGMSIYELLLNRLKVISNMRIDEHRTIQDGALRFTTDQYDFEIRVSVAPTVSGEKVTLRILSEYIESFSPESLGMSEDQVKLLQIGVRKPFGMIVVSGPTGSGKSTTGYTLLHDVASDSINITTIEDPVEYQMSGINQIQVQADQGITFANGLRSIVRQDPDIIFVGEIRDNETAEIAVNAALTGHLLFTTFHANNASSTAPRLLEMAIEPYLLSSTLSLVVAQRLVRKLCVTCRYGQKLKRKDLKPSLRQPNNYFSTGEITLYSSKGCVACNNTGFRGRTIVTEILEVDESISDLISRKATSSEIENQAIKNGMKPLFVDGINKVKLGITSLEELLRVVEEPS